MPYRKLIFVAVLSLAALGSLQADTVTLKVTGADPLVSVGGLGGGRFDALLNGESVHVYCIDFYHYFNYGVTYNVDVTPLTAADFATETRHGSVPDDGWQYANGIYTALQRYMMAAWLTAQYTPYFANWSDTSSKNNAKGIQSAIWTLLDPVGAPSAPTAGNISHWLTQATTAIAQEPYNQVSDPFYAGVRIVSPVVASAENPQEFLVWVPEPAAVALLGTVMFLLGIRMRRRRS